MTSLRVIVERHPLGVSIAAGIFACVAFNLLLGQDANFDARNYHISSVYRLLNDRESLDLIPQVQTWFNPLVYIPAYVLIYTLPPVVASTILAAVQGLCGGVLFLVFHRAFAPDLHEPQAKWAALTCVGVGLTGALYLSEAGTTFVDGALAVLLLSAILFLLKAHERPQATAAATLCAVAGLLFGTSVGLKLTNAVFVVGYLAMILTAGDARRKAISVTAFGVGTVIGFAVSAGWWHYIVYEEYGNPIYPLAGHIFSGGPSIADDLSDPRFKPQHWWDLIWYPIRMALGTRPSLIVAHEIAAEVRFRDPRYLLGLVGAIVLGIMGMVDRLRRGRRATVLQQLAAFYIVSYLAWIMIFGIARYAIVLELLGGGLFLALVVRLVSPERVLRAVMVMAIVMVLATRPGVWDRTTFAGSWFGGEGFESAEPATYVLSANAPLAYINALLPNDSRVVRIAGSIPIDPDHGIGQMVRDIIEQSTVLKSVHDSRAPDDAAALRRFGLVRVANTCETVRVKIDPLEVCQLVSIR